MKTKIIYILSFSVAFILVTVGVIELNKTYKNIFEFDFSIEKSDEMPTELKNSTAGLELSYLKEYFETEFQKRLLDSIKANSFSTTDTIYKEVVKDNTLLDSLTALKRKLRTVEVTLAEQTKKDTQVATQEIVKDVIDPKWAKTTAKLFESMEPNKAAKVLTQYSDNEAREVIYSMKKRSAAEILSLLKPEFVNRITKLEK